MNTFKIQKMIEELTPGVYHTQEHKDYSGLVKRLENAFNYLDKYANKKDEFAKVSMKAGFESANKLIADAPAEFKRMTSEVVAAKELKRLAETKAKKEVLKMFDKLQIEKKKTELLNAVNELQEFERKHNYRVLSRYFTDAIRSLNATNIKYGV